MNLRAALWVKSVTVSKKKNIIIIVAFYNMFRLFLLKNSDIF